MCRGESATSPEREPARPRGPRVVILGAGLAGLTTADRLLRAGVREVTVLEASARAGGRVMSEWAGDCVVELGLSLEGSRRPLSWDSPVLELVDPPLDRSAGVLHPPPALPSLYRAYSALASVQSHQDASLPGYKDLRVEQIGREMSGSEKLEAARTMAAMKAIAGRKAKVVREECGSYLEGPGRAQIPLGEWRLVVSLMERIGTQRVHLKKEAVTIRWGTATPDQTPRAVVRCGDGSEYPAEFVVWTCSVGCLKRHLDGMFYPPLPPSKVDAIRKASFLLENKAFLVFDEPIWSWTDKSIDFKFDDKLNPNESGESTELPVKEGWLRGVREVARVGTSEAVVGVEVEGEGAVEMERLPDHVLVEDLLCLLRYRLGGPLPQPAHLIRSRWCDSGHTLGLRSGGGGPPALADPLPAPDFLPPVILFAGEGTSPTPGLPGAVLSGLREAERLLDILRDPSQGGPFTLT